MINFEANFGLILFLAFLAVYSYMLGTFLVEIPMRFVERQRRDSFRKWGMERELFWPTSLIWSIVMVVGVVTITVFLYWSLPSEIQITGNWTISSDLKQLIAILGIYFGIFGKLHTFKNTWDKLKKIEELREIYHKRFSVSEILSMYESLRNTPPLFWEEYANLPDDNVNEQANDAYRRRASPYQFSQSSRRERVIVFLAGLAVLIGVIALVV
ncbi:MAG: hypothetical protein OXI16_02920 [Chloroflexota bacterium]|nr:hypothetical protein [Chloroflexota bacterium]